MRECWAAACVVVCMAGRLMGGQTFNRSGANLKGDAGLLDGGLSVPTQSGVANFAGRTGQVSADLYEARSG